MREFCRRTWGTLVVAGAVLVAPAAGQTAADPTSPIEAAATWKTAGGSVTLLPDAASLWSYGLALETARPTAVSELFPHVDSSFAIDATDPYARAVFVTRGLRFHWFIQASLPTDGELLLSLPSGDVVSFGNLDFHVARTAEGLAEGSCTDRLGTRLEAFVFSGGLLQFDAARQRFEWTGAEVRFTEEWAHAIGVPEAAGAVIGNLLVEAPAVLAPDAPSDLGDAGSDPEWDPEAGRPYGIGRIGPDVIVGDIHDRNTYGVSGSIVAYSIGTVSCNIGDEQLLWISSTNQHPVIGQNLFRLRNGRFEHLGQSWLKHGFFALSQTLCHSDCQATDGSRLGVHCSDPYSASLNGSQSNLGPKYQVNAATGFFPYPPANPPGGSGTIGRRLQARTADVDPAQNSGAIYVVEGQYVTQDDAAAGNKHNNASYRRVSFTAAPNYNMNFVSGQGTQRTKPGIQAWKDLDAVVTLSNIDIPSDGRLILGYKVTDNGNGTWHYEYAVQNLNSDRSVRTFSVPVAAGTTITNIGFHDVDYHSNDGIPSGGTPRNFDGTDWTAAVAGGAITWSTQTHETNTNANALRWGTLYNFRFDANAAPQPAVATFGLFKPGTPTSITTATLSPAAPCVDSTPPVITCPGNITQEATSANGAVVTFTPTAVDDCSPSPTISCTPASGSTFPLGTTTVNCTATDGAGRTGSCSFQVTVRDTTAPTISCPGNQVRECTSPSGANVNFTVTATDAVDPNPTVGCTPASGSLFPFGTTSVNCSATDASGNTRTCSFTVTVRDTTAPTLNCPGNITVDCASGSNVTYNVTATDACDTTPTVVCNPPSGSAFPPGTSTVNCTATDDTGNTRTCAFNVTVQQTNGCFVGTVNTGFGLPQTVLRANGSAGDGCQAQVTVGLGQAISVSLAAAQAGPSQGAYALWAWRHPAINSQNLVIGGHTLGCTVNPTPFNPALGPQPFRCVRGSLGPEHCGSTREISGPPTAPFTLTRNQGFPQPVTFTLQAILQDIGADNGSGFSVTNGITLVVQ